MNVPVGDTYRSSSGLKRREAGLKRPENGARAPVSSEMRHPRAQIGTAGLHPG
jgi:hypothetical protein